jgi:hypothetical protein
MRRPALALCCKLSVSFDRRSAGHQSTAHDPELRINSKSCIMRFRSLTAGNCFAIFYLIFGLQTAQAQTSIVVVGAGTASWGGCSVSGTWSTNNQAAEAAFTQCGYAGWDDLSLAPCVPPVPIINQGAGCSMYTPNYPYGPIAWMSTQLQEQSTGLFWTQASSLFICPKNRVGPDPIDPGSGAVF